MKNANVFVDYLDNTLGLLFNTTFYNASVYNPGSPMQESVFSRASLAPTEAWFLELATLDKEKLEQGIWRTNFAGKRSDLFQQGYAVFLGLLAVL